MSKNTFTNFKNRYAGKDAVAEKITARAEREMQKAYQNAYDAIYRIIQTAKGDVNYATYAKQTQILKQIGAELDGFKGTAGKSLNRALKEIAKYSARVAIRDLHLLTSKTVHADQWHREYNLKYVEQTFKDNYSHIAAQATRMKSSAKTLLRTHSAKVFQRAAVEGLTRRAAYQKIKADILADDPKFVFTDKRGRNWDTANYFDMLTKTVMHNTLRECYANTLINEGKDLVKVSHSGAKDACKKWEGKVLSLTGATTGYKTVDEARKTGEVFHPRCRHRLLAYHEGIEDVFKAVEDGLTDDQILNK